MFLKVSQLSVHYSAQAKAAVDTVSLGLQDGEIGVLIGPSGCGKTTLLRAVAGLERASAGTIGLKGQVVSDRQIHLPAEKRSVGMVFQDYALFPHLSVGRNVAFGIHQRRRAEQNRRVADMLDLVGLSDMGDRYPHELSGGQQQRVALARALAPAPALLLLDEPFSNLDVDLRERLAYELRGILKSAGATALFVTHDQSEAFAIGDRIGVMHAGKMHQWDDAYTLYHRPATRFVADFIGHGVFAPAQIVQQGDEVYLRTPLGDLRGLEECPVPSAYPDGRCDILLRADDVVHDDTSAVKARVVRKAFRGAMYLCTLELDGGQTVLAQLPSHDEANVGERIGIRPDVRHVVTFRSETAVSSSAT